MDSLSAEAVAVHGTVLIRHNRRRLNAKAGSDLALAIRVRDIMLRSLMQTRLHLMILGRLEALEGIALVRIVPEIISVLDYTKGFGHTELVAA